MVLDGKAGVIVGVASIVHDGYLPGLATITTGQGHAQEHCTSNNKSLHQGQAERRGQVMEADIKHTKRADMYSRIRTYVQGGIDNTSPKQPRTTTAHHNR